MFGRSPTAHSARIDGEVDTVNPHWLGEPPPASMHPCRLPRLVTTFPHAFTQLPIHSFTQSSISSISFKSFHAFVSLKSLISKMSCTGQFNHSFNPSTRFVIFQINIFGHSLHLIPPCHSTFSFSHLIPPFHSTIVPRAELYQRGMPLMLSAQGESRSKAECRATEHPRSFRLIVCRHRLLFYHLDYRKMSNA